MPSTMMRPEAPTPRSGPRILFFSGGTALKETARALTLHTYNSTHLITPFDSGGSTQTLRRAFAMPAVGDVRARVIALSDYALKDAQALHAFFDHRLPVDDGEQEVLEELRTLYETGHPLLADIPGKTRALICENLAWFVRNMPERFSLAGANIGNLFLAARYLRSNRRLRPAILLFSRLMRARGIVLPVVDVSAHLAVRLESGQVIVGQHNFTGKSRHGAVTPISSPIADCWLTASEYSPEAASVGITSHIANRIRRAELVCYPIGSFYSSVLCNLLPAGVGQAVAQNHCPKVFVPNLGTDPELLGHTVQMQVERLLRPLLADAPGAKPADMLSMLLVDRKNGEYSGGIPEEWLANQGIAVKDTPLVNNGSAPLADADLLAKALIGVSARKHKDSFILSLRK